MFNAMLNKVNGGGATCLIALAMSALTACENEVSNEPDAKDVTFVFTNDCSDQWQITRGLEADGKAMTDIWILDYMDGNLVQQVHQDDNTADDFGKPTITLSFGSHHLYFIVTRGVDTILNTTTHTMTFGKVRDTFWRDFEFNITASTNGSQVITLDRIVTKLKLAFTDVIPTGTSTINITPHTWNYGFDYLTGEPTAATIDQIVTVDIPASEIGKTTSASIYGFSGATQWTTDIIINSKKSDNTVLGQAVIVDAPFMRNRVTECSGPLFSGAEGLTLSLNTDWIDSYQGTW